MKNIILIGGGGHCKSCIDVIEQNSKFKIAGIIDKPELLGKAVLGYKVIGNDNNLLQLSKKYKYALITVGQIKNANLRIKLFNLAKKNKFILPTIISSVAYISKHSQIDEGTIIMHNVTINVNAQIGANCIINTGAIIEHDAIVNKHCHISTSAIINGGVEVGEASFYGSNVTSKEYTKIKNNSFIKAGSIVK